jgi:hypothetical protein
MELLLGQAPQQAQASRRVQRWQRLQVRMHQLLVLALAPALV